LEIVIGIVVVVTLLLLFGGAYRIATRSRSRRKDIDEESYGELEPGPQFVVHKKLTGEQAGPGFVILSRPASKIEAEKRGANNQKASPGNNQAHAKGFNVVDISNNPTAFCKLTGKQVSECDCDRHNKRGS
jgi:hypothetical protein